MDVDQIRSKRRRSSSISSSGEDSDDAGSQASDSLSPAPKYHRAIEQPGPSRPFLCTLPPTCSQPATATSYSTEEELLRHQDTFHKWVCRTPIKFRIDQHPLHSPVPDESRVPEAFVSRKNGWEYKECGKVFPDERLLDLHHLEVHDPIAREKKERGEKIFQCFIPQPDCKKTFISPARRRRHLIDKHHYPAGYFFSITNHGLNRIAQEDGLAISLIRPRKVHTSTTGYGTSINEAVPTVTTNSQEVDQADMEPLRPEAPADSDPAVSVHGGRSDDGMDVEALTNSLESSLQFVPRGVKKKPAK